MLPKTAGSAQTHKSMSFIWIVWSTLYVYLCLEPKSRAIRVPIVILIHSTDFGLPALSNRNHFGVFDKVFLLQICPLAALAVAGLLNWVLKAARAAAEAEGQVLYRRFVYQIGVPEIVPEIELKIDPKIVLKIALKIVPKISPKLSPKSFSKLFPKIHK